MNYYLGLTIGPIYDTVSKAKRIRQMWGSSYIFSFLMRELLVEVKKQLPVELIISPNLDAVIQSSNNITSQSKKYYDAGILPDRCYIKVSREIEFNEVEALRDTVIDELSQKIGIKLKGFLQQYLRIYAVGFQQEENIITEAILDNLKDLKEKENYLKTHSFIFQLNNFLDQVELQAKYVKSGDNLLVKQLDEPYATRNLYKDAYNHTQFREIFIEYQALGSAQYRLPSILEICTNELKSKNFQGDGTYNKIVTKSISKQVKDLIEQAANGQELSKEQITESDQNVMNALKSSLNDDFLLRYKYICLIYADGDNMGRTIAGLQNDSNKINTFSEEMAVFGQDAAKEISEFGGLPVYIGGDDLLFIAPLVNQNLESVFHLMYSLNQQFNAKKMMKDHGTTLSFGLSIAYYKFPIGENLKIAHKSLEEGAKTIKWVSGKEKDGFTFRLQKHSGNAFSASLPFIYKLDKDQRISSSFLDLIQHGLTTDLGVLSSVVYKFQQLGVLVLDAVRKDRMGYFIDNHFNEGQDRILLEKVKTFCAETINSLLITSDEKLIETIVASLRLMKFLKEKDNE